MIISWGIPTIKVTPGDGVDSKYTSAITFPTPVDGSTQLSSEKGDKMEALIEGGEPEAVKYKRGKYTLEFQVRIGKDRLPSASNMIDGTDGVVPGEWQVKLEPEDKASGAPGFTMPKAVCSYTDTYSSADGIIRTYTFDSLKPDTGAQIQWDE
jgi:hypothetical protein